MLISVLILAGSDLARTRWEQEFVTWLGEHDQSVFGLGVVGFDVGDIAWSRAGFDPQKTFLLNMIDKARQRYRWEELDYDPSYADEYLRHFRRLIEKYRVEMVTSEKGWHWYQAPEKLEKCPFHGVFMHANGCHRCNDR